MMGASNDEQEAQPAHDDDGDDCGNNFVFNVILIFLGFCAIIFLEITLSRVIKDPPKYSIAIADASGLDSLPAPLISPAFNVTVRVTSRSYDEECLDPATSVRVSYLGAPLAAGRVHRPAAGGCAPPQQHADLAVMARGKEVAVPGYLLDSLAEDMRTGQAVFEVTLITPNGRYGDVRTCWGRIGDAAALEKPCAE